MSVGSSESRRRRRRWRFGAAVFDETSWTLTVAGSPVELEGKPLQLLHELLLNAGEAVTKAELFDAVWPGVHVVEASLTTAVSKLRGALGDGGADVIQTLPRIGYRLAVPVEVEQSTAPLTPRFAFAAGDRVPGRPQWILEQALGDTGAADVWRARHEKVPETRIFKFADTPDRLRGLRREVALFRLMQAALGERRPCVDVLEWNFDASPYFIEAEDCGQDLKAWAGSWPGGLAAVPLDARLALVEDLARGLAAAHEVGVLHKDLKPSNILIDDGSADRPRVRLADFGSGWLMDRDSLALHGISGGAELIEDDDGSARSDTAAYRAPEVVKGAPPGMASDIYALGLILYQMIVGDLDRPLTAGWEDDVADPLLRDDVAAAAAGDVGRRLPSAALLAERLSTLTGRRAALEAEAAAQAQAQEDRRREETRAARRPWVRLAAGVGAAGLIATTAAAVVAWNQRDAARTQAAAAQASYSFLIDDLLGQTNPLSGSPAEETLAAAALRAREAIDARFADQPQVAADLHLSLATAFVQRGQYDEARKSFALADAAFERAGLSRSPAAARGRLLHARAEALSAQPGSLDAAKRIVATERARLGPDADRGMLGFHVAQAEAVIGFFSDIEAADAAFARALTIAEAGAEGLTERDVVLTRQQRAVVLMRLGRAEEALPLLRRVVEDWSRLAGPDQANTLIARQNLAHARLMTGDVTGALAAADALLPDLQRRFGADNRYTLALRSTRQEALMHLGRHADAAVEAEAVWRGAAASQGPRAHQTLVGLGDLGSILCRAGEHDRGLERLRAAWSGSREAFGDDYALSHVMRFMTGECLVFAGRHSEAASVLRDVDRAQVGSLMGDADWGITLDLALAEIAVARGDLAAARALLPRLAPLGTEPVPALERRRHAAVVAATRR